MVKQTTIMAHPNNYRVGRRSENRFGLHVPAGTICAVVWHDMESAERLSTAEDVGNYFARGDIRQSSAHKGYDADSICRYVDDKDTAYHAPPASAWSLGKEMAGVARQTSAEWHDPYSWAMLRIMAEDTAADCDKYNIPKRLLDASHLKAGIIDGIYDHNAVSKAFGQSAHWDVGLGFPFGEVIAMVQHGAAVVPPPPAGRIVKYGDCGGDVGFLQGMCNFLILAGFIKAEGLEINDPACFGPKTQAAVIASQKFFNGMLKMAHNPKRIRVDGVADHDTVAAFAYWVPEAQRVITKAIKAKK